MVFYQSADKAGILVCFNLGRGREVGAAPGDGDSGGCVRIGKQIADRLCAERFVLATGSRPRLPPVPSLAGIPYLTSDTIMRLDTLPRSMAVLGGGYIAAEMSHIFGSLGTTVTIVERGEHLLSHHDTDIRARFTERYRDHAGYVAAVRKVADIAMAQGYLLQADHDALIAAADASNVLR